MKVHLVLFVWLGVLLLSGEGSGQTQADLNAKAAADFASAEKELAVTYQKLVNSLDAPGREKLVQAQNAWLAYREAQAAFEADQVRGGTAALSILDATRAELTRNRIERLKKILHK